MFGYWQSGPTEVARKKSGRGFFYFESLRVRLIFLVPASLLVFAVSFLLDTVSVTATFLMACSYLVINVGAGWFYVGESNPLGLFLFDTLPRVGSIIAATFAISIGLSIEYYTALVLGGSFVAVAVSSVDIFRRYGRGRLDPEPPRRLLSILKDQRHGVGTAVLSTAYLQAPMLVLQHMVPSAIPVYALADKVKQQALSAYRPVSQVIQGWTPAGSHTSLVPRIRRATWAVLAASILGSVGFGIALPILSSVLGGNSLSVGVMYIVPFSLAFGMSIISLTVGVACLVPLGLERHVTASAALGSATILFTLVPFILIGGGVGAAYAVLVSQMVVALYQLVILRSALRKKMELSNV
ncbi:hypothetical protein [Rhodococcus globerulus]|uniref:hypothetical protein n=1 Tax=Rhodococcus globerulus TaxID=33008 RepID=UPI003019CBAC